jgi:hypothetical protein
MVKKLPLTKVPEKAKNGNEQIGLTGKGRKLDSMDGDE